MAILRNLVVAASAFAALSAARPLAIRDVTSVVTETEWTTIDVPVTLWVNEDGVPLSTVAQGGNFAAATPVASSASTTTAQAAETPKVIQSSALPSSPQAAAVVPTTTAAPYVATPQTTSAYVQPTTTAAAPAATTTAATNSASSGQSSGTCQGEGSGCTGDITHWDGGLGACGWNVNTDSDMQIALPVGLMGSQSNGNPYCGKSLTIKNPNTGATVQATVGDKCMGCTGNSIDLTNALFNAIGGGCDGRCSGFEWWFD